MAEDNKFIEDDLAILAEFVDESEADLNATDRLFVELEARPGDIELINSIFRPLHSIKGNSAFLGLMQVRRLAHEMENLLDDLRKQRCSPTPDLISILLAGVDEVKAILERIRKREGEVADEKAFNQLIASFQRMRQGEAAAPVPAGNPVPIPGATPAKPSSQSAAPAKPSTPAGATIERTIRIPERQLDELDKIGVRLAELSQQMNPLSSDPKKAAEASTSLSEATANLKQLLEALRSVPASELLQRAPRIARETAASIGKKAQVQTAGETIRMPRSIAGILETPLMHMVRNAVDHGLEAPELRRRTGKPEEGLIKVEVREEQGGFILTVADDGPGIDFKSLLTKAMARGLVARNAQITPELVMNLIFLPGISSAKQVTDISGRGVGMDVVKKMVESAGGTIQVQSKTGKGTEFIVSLPRG